MRFAQMYSRMKPSGMLAIFQAAAADPDIVNLGEGEPDFDTEHDIADAAASGAKEGYTHYGPVQGYEDVREAVCRYWERRYGLKSTPGEVMMMTGGCQSSHLALQALLDPGDEVIVAEPCFPPYFEQIAQHRGVAVHLSTTEEQGFVPAAEDVERLITPRSRVLMLCSPNNPTGRVMTRAQMEPLAAVAEKHDLVVLSDEIYDSMVYKGRHLPFAALPGMKERALTMGGLSKSHCMTGWRIGYAIGPEPLIRTMALIGAAQTYGVNAPTQRAALYALDTHDARMEERAAIFRDRLTFAAKRLNAMPGVRCAEPEGAFYLFSDIRGTGLSSDRFAHRLLTEAKVAAIPGSAFGECGEGYLRIACTRSTEELERGMDRMEAFVREL